MMIFDTHAHYDDEAFDGDRELLLEKMAEKGIGRIVNIGADLDSTKQSAALAEKYDFIYAAAGVHPSDTDHMTEADMDCLRSTARCDKVVAIGEIGLDYHYPDIDKASQKKWFQRQLALAEEMKLPVVIHSRDAAQDTLAIMQENHAERIGGVIHCFSYGWEMAKIYLDMGFYLGIGGVLTFKNAKKLKEVVQRAPIDRLVLETDAPYLAPEPFRGKRNESPYLSYVAEALAQLKGLPVESVVQITAENAEKLYRLEHMPNE